MLDKLSGNVLTFNGEIFNYVEIRNQLIGEGIYFDTESDTEVLLKFLGKFGFTKLQKLNGMFAFAFFSKAHNKVYLVRDSLGKKPLYYTINNKGIRWSSSQRFLQKGHSEKSVSDISLYQYLSLGYLLDPTTTDVQVKAVRPGHIVEIDIQQSAVIKNVNFSEKNEFVKDISGDDSLRQVISESIHDRTKGHDRIALSMSGGVDSSIIAVELSKSNAEVQAFTAHWPDSDKSRYNVDSEIAHSVSRRIGIKIQKVEMLRAKDLSGELRSYLQAMEEPNNNASGVSMLKLYKTIADFGFRLVLTGDGADEIFAGYSRYAKAAKFRNIIKLNRISSIRHSFVDSRGRLTPIRKLMSTQIDFNSPFSWLRWHWIFTPTESANLLNEKFNSKYALNFLTRTIHELEPKIHSGSVDSLMQRDHKVWLSMESNRRLDRISMYNSVEARSPFQDGRIIKWAEQNMPEVALNGFGKSHLWKAYPELTQLNVRRDKAGFISPLGHWLRLNTDLVSQSLSRLSRDSRFCKRGLKYYSDAPQRGNFRELTQLWTLVVLAQWLQVQE
jgi:asparagine synthase (glutamine-hydrolysing)